jgi:hypothetical protein
MGRSLLNEVIIIPFETYEELPNATNKELVDFLREQIFVVLEKADLKRKIFVACFNTIIAEIENRLKIVKFFLFLLLILLIFSSLFFFIYFH